MEGLDGVGFIGHSLPFDQLCISDAQTNDGIELLQSSPSKSSRKKVLVNVSVPAEVETFEITAPSVNTPPFLSTASAKSAFHLEIDSVSPPNADVYDLNDYTWHPRLHVESGGGRRYHCRQCRKKFLRKRDLNRHQHAVHGVSAYICKTRGCTERFETMTELVNHRRCVHLTTRTPKICKLCSRKFVTERSLMVHLRWHNQKPFKCKECGCCFLTRKEWYQHRNREHPLKEKNKSNSRSPVINTAAFSKKVEEELQVVLSRLPAILPKPPSGSHPKLPLPPIHHSVFSTGGREVRPLVPASFVNSFPEENYVPIYSSRPSSVSDNPSEHVFQVHPPINALLPPQYSQANYENIYPPDSSYCIQSYQNLDVGDQGNSGYGVQVETGFGVPPVEVVDLNTYPMEVSSLTDFNWSNSDAYAVDHNQNWLQPITLYGESQQDAELMQMVEETLQGDLIQDL